MAGEERRSTLAEEAAEALAKLAGANRRFAERYPGDAAGRQPVHTVYGGAHLFRADTARRLGDLGLRAYDAYGADPFDFAGAIGLPGHERLPAGEPARRSAREAFERDPRGLRADDPASWLALTVGRRVRHKLETEPVEDFRIDFEDGFGHRPDEEEDETAVRAAREVARGMEAGTLPPFVGIRIKPLDEELKLRAVRTLDLFVTTLVEEAGRLPDHFVVTLPKVPVPEQVETLVVLFERLERRLGLDQGALRMELMIELTQTLMDAEGRSPMPRLLGAARGRCTGAHFGTYDYTASAAITAAHQRMDHPACDFAKQMMKIAFAGTGVFLSDGATNVMPVAPHRGPDLTEEQAAENRASVHGAWRMAADHIRHSLIDGFYQGWDLHPAQLPVRYGTVYGFFLEGLSPAAERLRNFVEKAAQATLVGDVFDDAATGQGLLNYFLRALNCGAVTLEELTETGLTREEIATRSFNRIMERRRAL